MSLKWQHHKQKHGREQLEDIQTRWQRLESSLHSAASEVVPLRVAKQNRPWISQKTLALIELRHRARQNKNAYEERSISKQIEEEEDSNAKRRVDK